MDMSSPGPFRIANDWPHIVIPYSYADHEFAHKLAGALRRDLIAPRIDEVDMSAGVFLVNRLSHAARPVDFVVPAISITSVTSDWVQHELRTAVARGVNGRPIRVLPAKVDDSALPDYLRSQPCFDFHGHGWNVAYDDLRVIVQRRTNPGLTLRPHDHLLRRRWGS
jgi:hypothetical protein